MTKKTEKLMTGLTMKKYEFRENNSGGSWWLNKKQYQSLMAKGWKLEEGWDKPTSYGSDPTKPFGGDNVPYGWRNSLYFEADSIQEAVESWENATGEDFFEQGCNCCGAPFSMSGGNEYLSGNSVDRITVRPW